MMMNKETKKQDLTVERKYDGQLGSEISNRPRGTFKVTEFQIQEFRTIRDVLHTPSQKFCMHKQHRECDQLETELLVRKCSHKRDYMMETRLFIKEIYEK